MVDKNGHPCGIYEIGVDGKPMKGNTVPRGAEGMIASDILIDMSGWTTGDRTLTQQEYPIYPFVIRFRDPDKINHSFASEQIDPAGFYQLSTYVRKTFGVRVRDDTKVTLFCPQEAYDKAHMRNGDVQCCTVLDLRNHAMNAIRFIPTTENHLDERIESVLDCVVHRSCMEQTHERPKPRGRIFQRSGYHFDVEDNDTARKLIEANDLHAGYGCDY